MATPRTPSPPSSPPEMEHRTPLRSGGSTYPWDQQPYHQQHVVSLSPLTPRRNCPATAARGSPPHPPSSRFLRETTATSATSVTASTPANTNLDTAATPHASSSQLFLKQEEVWQTLYPSEIAAFDSPTLREKLLQSNALLTRLSSSLSEARTKAAHYTFQHRLLTIETNEAMQRHLVESEITKREVEVLRKDGSSMADQQRFELEEMVEMYKKRLRRAKTLLRDTREELNELRQENDRLKKRIRENRQHRIRDMEADIGYGPAVDEYRYEENYDRRTNVHGQEESSPSVRDYPSHYHEQPRHYQPTPLRSSATNVLSSSLNPEKHTRTPHSRPIDTPRRKEEDALATLGMLASQVLSQEGLSEPHTPRTAFTQITPRATTPVRRLSTTVPTTPLSQSRNLPGPQPSTSRTPKTPRRGGKEAQTAPAGKGSNSVAATPVSKKVSAAGFLGTPKYTSPVTGPASSHKATTIEHEVTIPQTPPPPQGKKRKLSSDSTLSANADEEETTSLNDSEIETMILNGSPIPLQKKKGKMLSNGYVYGIQRGDRYTRFHKRTRGENWGHSNHLRRG